MRQVDYIQELDLFLFHSFSLFMVGKPDGKKTVGRFGHRLEDNIKTGIEKMNVCALARNVFRYWGIVKPAVHVQAICCLSAQQIANRGITSMQLVYLMTLSITEGYIESNDRISSERHIGTYAKVMWPSYISISAEEYHKHHRRH